MLTAPADAGARVLVIDDSALAREVIRDLLEVHGYRVDELDSPLGATAHMLRSPYAAVVVDFHMPTMTGDRFAEVVRRTPKLSAVRIVLVSGVDEAELDGLRRHPAVDAVVAKRAMVVELVPALRRPRA